MSDRSIEAGDAFTPAEREILGRYFTDVDGPVFALVNLPEVVKGALFARYSRSASSLKRLFLDEFVDRIEDGAVAASEIGVGRAEKLYEKVFVEYGDDSVAQLGGVHLACENCSNVLTKILEWGRIMAYLEQSTRYVPYTDRPGGAWNYHIPAELTGHTREVYVGALDLAFATYARLLEPMQQYFRERYPRQEGVSSGVYQRTLRAKALDALRGLLPAATRANVGIYGTGQAYEALLLRMRANPLAEVRDYAERMLVELRKVIPAFLTRVDQEDRGLLWSRYLRETREQMAQLVAELPRADDAGQAQDEVVLSDFDPDGEIEVVAAALYAVSDRPDSELRRIARELNAERRCAVLQAYVGQRRNRRHKPGRAFERARYRFDVLSDYGAFRDLQRHRLLTLEWQRLSVDHGFNVADAIEQAGQLDAWNRVMQASAAAYRAIVDVGLPEVAPYAVSMAYRVRYYMEMNAREAMHVLELRTAPQGHASYRRVCQKMHRLIAERAGHRAIAASMSFVDHGEVELERLESELAAERRRTDR